ncbi:zinc transporter ZIP10-like isoform X1 [Mytilus californianus]|uniref:zinc transporter ZIP10-like isoform X1 n=3 Tax=Mytilus californianus TaxID=6549 RepID=UPI0022453564|nr:zinc transporter ZIP10-like isoform X1 [Mytilus californianus]
MERIPFVNTAIVCYLLHTYHVSASYNGQDEDFRTTNHSKSHDSNIFIDNLFNKYGNKTVMTFEGFEHLMNGIELGNIILEDSVNAHRILGSNETEFKSLHHHNHSHVVDVNHQLPIHKRKRRHVHYESERPSVTESSDILKMCLSPVQILDFYDIHEDEVITRRDFEQLCPALIVQLDQRRCLKMGVLIRYRDFATPETLGTKAWGYGFVCLIIISISGLLVISLVPLLQRISFDGILQFMISLAVGALTGDAMLHLLPHALVPEVETDHEHDHESGSHNHENIYKALCGLSTIYFFFLISRIQTIFANSRMKENNNKLVKIPEQNEKLNTEGIEILDFEQEFDVQIHHNHGHTHTHVVPISVSGMLWRIIIGDGIHNFSDGLAIGVAFANSITGGVSTSIAVLCHELPHEMGDFAMLLKKGMSVKRAVLFNCLSSLLSCIGMVIGIAVGNISAVSLWIFVAIAGMFIYISLVDMLPELTSVPDGEEHSWRRLFVQICGLGVGTGIMLTIAIYEEKIKTMLE